MIIYVCLLLFWCIYRHSAVGLRRYGCIVGQQTRGNPVLWLWARDNPVLWLWPQRQSSLMTIGPGAIQFYILGLMCKHCICIVVCGIFWELTKFWLMIVDFNVFRFFWWSGARRMCDGTHPPADLCIERLFWILIFLWICFETMFIYLMVLWKMYFKNENFRHSFWDDTTIVNLLLIPNQPARNFFIY